MGNTAKARHRRRYRLLHDKQGGRVTWLHQDWAPRFRAYLDRVWGGDYRAWAVSWAADAGAKPAQPAPHAEDNT